MDRPAFSRSFIAFVMGLLALRLAITGKHRQFVRAGLGPYLIAAGLVLCLLAVIALLHDDAPDLGERGDDHNHYRDHSANADSVRHSVGPGWLLLLPVMALFLVAPAPIGSWGLKQVGSSSAGRSKNWAPLPLASGPIPVRLREVVGRANDATLSLRGRPLLLEGFVVRPGGSFALARYSIACCAADAQGAQVLVEGQPISFASDSWVRVIGSFVEMRGDVVVVRASSVDPIPSPPEPFE